MALIDEITIYISSGKGGDGVVRWRREKFKPLSGPGGGNGGRGGDVYAQAISDLSYLETYRHTKEFNAENGHPGGSAGKHGKDGQDLVLQVPVGSVITNMTTREQFELTHPDEKILLLKGGRGGLGNEYFKSSRNTTPKESTLGQPGEDADFHIELKLFADIGLIGFPSAGKSTLLNALTHAKSKVAEYHFTTLDPHLGAFYEFVLADIPGLIEGASQGKGLGTKFLKHISRTKALAHVISLESEDIEYAYHTIRNELGSYDQSLLEKDEIIILTKSDMVDEKTVAEKVALIQSISKSVTLFIVSAYDDQSIKRLSDGLITYLRSK